VSPARLRHILATAPEDRIVAENRREAIDRARVAPLLVDARLLRLMRRRLVGDLQTG
jgi:hypothetical protein